MNKFETNKDNEYLLQYLQTENKTKDEIIAKATKIIESLQKEIKLSKKKAFKPEYLNENYNKKLQIPRSLKLNYKENLKNEDFSEIFETHNEMLKLQGKLEIEHKEKVILQASLEELQKKLEINENLYKKKELELNEKIQENKEKTIFFNTNLEKLNTNIEKLLEKQFITQTPPVIPLKKLDNLNLIQDLYEIFSYFTKEINILIEQNKEKIIENTDKLHNLADFSFYDKRIIALETDNREKNEKITEITKKNVILTAMIFDHQKALKYYRNVLNEFSGLFQILNLKKTEISDALKGGFEMIRLNRNLDEKKYIKGLGLKLQEVFKRSVEKLEIIKKI